MNRESTRAELLKALADLSEIHPNWRLGQMLANVAMAAGHTESEAVWELQDEEALTAARTMLESTQQRIAT
jgi:hypothetical protein